ncbi:unnamed protein product [Darwinula stevensoni]|uniref:Gustatory receptor n=1 Tax=Darwinula stevensoni TaxID=69355 RepID=A0A7R9A7R6_9CRUS|nr:unnamed protein product [Darwinula stevensoni]CAG0894644.1 unnamed protein product [Darwinula stevensoni]
MAMTVVEPFEDENGVKRVNEEERGSEVTFRGLKVTLGLGTILGSFPFSVTGPGVTVAFSWRSVSFLWTVLLFFFYTMDAVYFFSDLSRGEQTKTIDLEAQGNSGISAEIIAIQRSAQRLFYLTVIGGAMVHKESLARALSSVCRMARPDAKFQRDLLCGYLIIQAILLSTFFMLNRSQFTTMSWSQWILFLIHKMVTTNALAFYAPLYALHPRVLARTLLDLKLDLEGFRLDCTQARARYREIRDTVRSLNRGFGLVIIMLHGYIAYTLVEQLYLIATLTDMAQSVHMTALLGSVLTSVSRIVVDVAILLIINWPAQQFLDRDQELREYLSDMEGSGATSGYGDLGSIEKNRSMMLTGAGYLTLGKRLIMKAFGMVVSYTVLLVQFRQAEVVRGSVRPINR